MTARGSDAQVLQFGAFQADLRSGELYKHGIRIKIQDQPFQVLAMLLERPGEVVTREELLGHGLSGSPTASASSG